MRFIYKVVLFMGLAVTFPSCNPPGLQVNNLTCERTANPLGIETPTPVFAWQNQSHGRDVVQTAYRVLVADNPYFLDKDEGNCWDSGKVSSENSILIFYEGIALTATKTYYWKVKTWDNHGNESVWSKIASWQMGLLSPVDWGGARWIAMQELPADKRVVPGIHGRGPDSLGDMKNTLPMFRRDFTIEKPLKRATAFISGLGHFEMSLNGKKIGDHFLDPGWTNYDKYALYVTFDITPYLQKGANVCGIMLGNGFYHTPRERYLKCVVSYGYPKMIGKIWLEYADGTTAEIITDSSWKMASSPVVFSSIYGGEDYDAGLEQPNWDQPGFEDSHWKQPLLINTPLTLYSQTATPVKILQEINPSHFFQASNGKWIYDLGQNFSGIIRLSAKGEKGQTIRIWPGELLNDDSIIYQNASGHPFYFQYTLGSKKQETWQARFTYYGFRYLMLENAVPKGVDNPDGLPVINAIYGLHTGNSATKSGSFECSNALFNDIHSLIDWAIRSNMASVFTDCPHREKLGWLEEIHLMGNSIAFNYDISRLCSKVIEDMNAAQLPNGMIPDIAPEFVVFKDGFRDSPEWGSAYIILPWYVYKWYGDIRILESNYEGMKRYVDYLTSTATNCIVSHGLGDWFDVGPKDPGVSQLTSTGVTATAIYYYDVCIMQRVAGLLGKENDQRYYLQLAEKIKKAFNDTFFNPETGSYDRNSQAANAMAIYMNLVEPEFHKVVFENIIGDLKEKNYSQTPGDIGFRYFLRVLEREGASETIFTINNRNDVPGYGFQLAKGATALTESWAALRYVSNNHMMLGHLMEWFYSGLAGIRQADHSIAHHEIVIHPEPVGDITYVKASYASPYGIIISDWKKDQSLFKIYLEIPVNTTALVYFPSEKIETLTEKGKSYKAEIMVDTKGKNAIKIGSGKYNFCIEI